MPPDLQTFLDDFFRDGVRRSLARGETLFDQGERATGLYGLSGGRLRLERHLPQGDVLTVGVLRAPSLVAEASLFTDRLHCRAVAETESHVVWRSRSDVLGRIDRDPAFARRLLRHLSSEVRDLRSRLELRNVRPAAERLLTYLRLHGPSERPLVAVAAELGLTPEAVYRVVRKLELEGRIVRHGRRLDLPEET